QTFLPPSKTSFGHLRSGCSEYSEINISATLTAAANEIKGREEGLKSGPRITEKYRPASGGENHGRPCRPLPAVCSRATITVPSLPARPAISRATSLVDSTESNLRTDDPILVIRPNFCSKPGKVQPRVASSTNRFVALSDALTAAAGSSPEFWQLPNSWYWPPSHSTFTR